MLVYSWRINNWNRSKVSLISRFISGLENWFEKLSFVSTKYLETRIRSVGATENAGVEMNDVARIRNAQNIRRPKNKSNMLQDKPIKSCLSCTIWQILTFFSSFYRVRHSTGPHAEHFVRQTTERTRKRTLQQRLCDHFNGSGADKVTLLAPKPLFGFHNIRIFILQSVAFVTNPKTWRKVVHRQLN